MDALLYLASVRDLPDPAEDASLLALLPPERWEKLSRIRQPGARRLSFGAWLLLCRALAEAGAEPGPLAFGPHGKPFFPTLPTLHFNLSHSGGTVLCALSGSELGCDVETLAAAKPELAARFFHPAERDWLAALPAAAQGEGFFRLWTLKESVLKATGLGLSLPLSSFAVDLSGAAPRLLEAPDGRDWRLLSFLDGPCACALCCAADARPVLRRVELTV